MNQKRISHLLSMFGTSFLWNGLIFEFMSPLKKIQTVYFPQGIHADLPTYIMWSIGAVLIYSSYEISYRPKIDLTVKKSVFILCTCLFLVSLFLSIILSILN